MVFMVFNPDIHRSGPDFLRWYSTLVFTGGLNIDIQGGSDFPIGIHPDIQTTDLKKEHAYSQPAPTRLSGAEAKPN